MWEVSDFLLGGIDPAPKGSFILGSPRDERGSSLPRFAEICAADVWGLWTQAPPLRFHGPIVFRLSAVPMTALLAG